ncbi:uncharacterized protein TNCV_1729521 [Trichonephila clavipes]|nr:uncharacterized protein TNCV_1729521 [Trichonephila clavipes]
MLEKALVDHIFVRLEPQVQNYVEVRNPQNTVQLLEILSKFEGKYSCKTMRGSGNSDNVERRGWNERRMSDADDNRRNLEVLGRPNKGRNYSGKYVNGHQGNQWFDSKNRFQRDDRRYNNRGYQFRNGVQNDDFSGGDRRKRGSSENFSRGDKRQRGRLNVLKVRDDQNDQTQSANEVLIKLSAIFMSPVDLPYVPILLNDTFTKALWDTGGWRNKPGLTHVLYHEIDTGDNPPVVSRPYRYDRVKQMILDYHHTENDERGNHNSDSIPVRVSSCVM